MDWPWYERSSDPEDLLPLLMGLPAERVAYQMSPVWWEYFALDCQRVIRHLQQQRRPEGHGRGPPGAGR